MGAVTGGACARGRAAAGGGGGEICATATGQLYVGQENSQQGSKFVKTGLGSFSNISGSLIAPPKKSNRMIPPLPLDQVNMPSHLSVSSKMPLSAPKSMPPPPPRNMPPPPKFPSNEKSRNENKSSASQELVAPPRSLYAISVLPPKFLSAQLPTKTPREEKIKDAVSDTLLRLMDYGNDDDDDIDATDSIPQGNPTPSSGQKPFWAV